MTTNEMMTQSQYKLYEITEPYVAEFVHPKMALKKPQPLPPFMYGLQHCDCQLSSAGNFTSKQLTLTCHTDLSIS
jgi:hypothetical protein